MGQVVVHLKLGEDAVKMPFVFLAVRNSQNLAKNKNTNT